MTEIRMSLGADYQIVARFESDPLKPGDDWLVVDIVEKNCMFGDGILRTTVSDLEAAVAKLRKFENNFRGNPS